MGLIQRENGFWYIDHTIQNKRYRFSTTTKDKSLAEKIFENFLISTFQNRFNMMNLTNNNQIHHLSYTTKSQPKSLISYLDDVINLGLMNKVDPSKIFIKERIKNILIVDMKLKSVDQLLSQNTINQFFHILKERNLSESSLRTYLSQLKHIFNYLKNQDVIKQSDISKLFFDNV